MEQEILKKVIENKNLFIPYLFTNRQINIMDKYFNNQILNNTEKVYFYSTIKKKIQALKTIQEEFYITGREMITDRIKIAKQILKETNKEKAFISGSFLYKKEYQDIDIYIISRKRKSYHQGNKHFTYITEKMLSNPIFISAYNYSVANFSFKEIKPIIKRPEYNDLIVTYEMAVNEILDNDDQKTIREIIFWYFIHSKNIILDSFLLYNKTEEIIKQKKEEKIKIINQMIIELVLKLFSKKYLYNELTKFLKELEKEINESKVHDNIIIYYNLLMKIKNECRRT